MSLDRNWVLQTDPVIYKFLRRVPRKDARRILLAIIGLPRNPFYGDIQKMGGEDRVWRRRIGAYRIKYELLF